MNKFLVLACACLAAESVFALPDYEPFSDSTGSGGTSYSVGANLIGQVNASGSNWITAGPAGNQPTIAAGDLNIAGLYTAGGNRSAQFGGAAGTSARLNLSVDALGIQSGTVYFSFALKLTDLTGMTSGGTFFAGFNNNQASQATTPNTIATRVMARSATGGYNIGVREGSTASDGNLAWGSTIFTTSDILFLVGSYTFNTGANNDVAQLWINPDSSTFGGGSAPGGALVSSGGVNDIARVASFTLYDQSAAEPAVVLLDNLRFGLTWADVTPVVPEPSTLSLVGLGLAAIMARRVGRKA